MGDKLGEGGFSGTHGLHSRRKWLYRPHSHCARGDGLLLLLLRATDVFKGVYHGETVAVKKWKPKGFGADQQLLFARELQVGRCALIIMLLLLCLCYCCGCGGCTLLLPLSVVRNADGWSGGYACSKVNHPNLVRSVGYCPNPLALLMEYAPGRELFDILHDRRVVYNWSILRHMAVGIARGLQHLHSIGAIHRDVKSPNVIVRGSPVLLWLWL